MILTFNAKSVDSKILENTLVGRKKMVDELYKELYEKCINDETYQSLIVAPRGSGKTHLTKVIYSRLKQAKELQDKIVIAYMVEDEYGVVNFTHFCLRVLTAIDRYNEIAEANIKAKILEISELPTKEQLSNITTYLKNILGSKKLIILVENFDTLLDGMKDNGASLRDFMHENNIISLMATAQCLTGQFNNSKYPFYNFFKTRHLKKLSFAEAFELIKALIDVEENNESKEELLKSIAENNEVKSKIRAIYELTSGNHRLLVHFYGFLKADVKSDLSKVFVKQMNDLKSYYEQFVGNLSVQQQRVVQLLSLNHTPLQGKKIAQMSFLEPNVVSKQLSILYKLGFIDKYKEGKNVYYEIREPLMRICFEINENPEGSAKLFVDFLKIIYDEADRKKHYLKYKLGYKHVEAKMKLTYISEAEIYERTLSTEDKVQLKKIEEKLQDCAPENLETEIEKFFIKKKDSELLNQRKANVYFNSGLSFYNQKEYRNAIKAFKKAIELDPQNGNIYFNLGNSYGHLDEFQNAITASKKAIQLDSEDYDAHNNLGHYYFKSGEFQNAIATLKIATQLNPKHYGAFNNLGISYNHLGEFQNAITAFEKAIQLNPKGSNIYYNLGNSYGQIGEFQIAIEAFEKAIHLNSEDFEAFNSLGHYYFQSGDFNKAIEAFDKAIQLNPKVYVSYNNLGHSYGKIGEFQIAIAKFIKATQLNPIDSDSYNSIAIAYLNTNKLQLAKKSIKKALDIMPKHPFYLGTLIQVKLYQNDWKSSQEILNQIFMGNLEYSSEIIGEDIIEAACRWTPEHLLLDQFIKIDEYFRSKEKSTLLYEGFTSAAFNIFIRIENYSKERLCIIQQVFEYFSKKSDKVIIPLLMLKVGIDYLKNGNDEALYDLSKEERQVFDSNVLQKRKHIKK